MSSANLKSDRLSVEISLPGELYTGSRFDWTTQVRQVTLDGHTFLTSEKEDEPSPARQGWGLAGEFGIETPVGFSDCAEGGLFPKIGVGLLRRPDDKPYHFARAYEIVPARFEARSEGAALLLIADQSVERGYGWSLQRHWSVRGAELTLSTTLANTGSKPLSTEEYIHNFLGFDGRNVDDWALTSPRAFAPAGFGSLIDKESLLSFDGPRLSWTRTPTRDFFFSDAAAPVPATWTLARPSGPSVTETVDFETSKFNVWGRGHVVSPELYRNVEVQPGDSLSWTRRWVFSA